MPTNRQRLMSLITGNPDLVERLLHVAEPPPTTAGITSPNQAYRLLSPHLVGHATERLVVVALDRRRQVIGIETLTIGTAGFTIVDPRQVYSWALRQGRTGASAILLGHNHPSGNPSPSQQDIDVTRRVLRAGRVLGVPLLDHIVVGSPGRFCSLAETTDLRFGEAEDSVGFA
jgi:DNA repair protein RadC